MELRPVTLDDARLLYEWRLQDEAADWWQGDHPSFVEHRAWLVDRLASPSVDFQMVLDGKDRVGQVRCDSNGEISISVAGAERGRGFGLWALEEATKHAHQRHGRVKACVDVSNGPARELFAKAGYRHRPDVMFWRFPR